MTDKARAEFDKFTDFMDSLAKVPHITIEAKLEAEKEAKEEKKASKSNEKP